MAETKVRQRKKTESRRAELLDIAAKIFAEEGYKEAGIERVLKQAGLTGPALYRHFSSKQEILDTICVEEMRHAIEIAHEIQREDLTSEQRLRKLIRTRIDHVFSAKGRASMLSVSQRAHLSPEAAEKVVGFQREFRTICGDMLKSMRPDASENEIKVLFFAVQNMLIYSMWRARDRSMLEQQDFKALLDKLVWITLLNG